jgi:hypothetical protein
MYHEQLVRVVVDSSRRDRAYCRYCGKPIVWRVTPNGRNIPLDADAIAVRADQNAETYVRYELFDRDAVHMATCKKMPKRHSRRGGRLAEAEARH